MSMHVLVVEDEALNREIAEVILSALCHEAGRRFDLILMDQLMPVMGGLEAIAALRGHEATRRVPILCLSAKATQQECEAAYLAGCDHYLTKPYRRRELLEAIALVMGPVGRRA